MNNEEIFSAIIVNDKESFFDWVEKNDEAIILDEDNATPLQEAISWNRIDMAIRLLEKNCGINNQDISGSTALHLAANRFEDELVLKLLEKGADISITDKYGNTPLWTAVYNSRGNYEIVDLLLKWGADPNKKNINNLSPLDFANRINDKELVKLLNSYSNKNK